MRIELLITVGVIVLVLILLNVIFLAILFFTRRKMSQVSAWPTTSGVVMSSMLESRSSEDGYTDYPVVQYSYQVGAQAFQSSRLAPGPEVGGSGARKVIERYPAGARVNVFYNPQNPAEAILEKKAPAQALLWIILGIFDCALCGAIPLAWWALSR